MAVSFAYGRPMVSYLGRAVRWAQRPACSAFSTLTLRDLPRNIVECEYAVRGSVLLRAEELQRRLSNPQDGDEPLPFKEIVPCNIGNPQAVGHHPLTFHRQLLACLAEPSLAEASLLPEDVRERAARYLSSVKVGAYSHSQGNPVFRQDVANFLTERDASEALPDEIFLTDGASAAAKMVLQLMVRGPKDGVLLPVPQYPLYSATMTLLGGKSVGYFLDENAGWGISVEELERSVQDFRKSGGTPRAIVIINPGNPTGQVLSTEIIESVLRFAERERLAVLADEVYQDNVHTSERSFTSMRCIALQLGIDVEIFSLHSVSKGVTGECGLRGGFVHCQNVCQEVRDQMYKLASISLCSNVLGQALMASALTPPPADGPSRALFDEERLRIATEMKEKAEMVEQRLNAMDGITCQPIEGAMYAFPRVVIKGYVMKKAISFATPADQIYCLEMVDRTGVVTVPGSGFGQKPGTFHFRMTILPDKARLTQVLDKIEEFHKQHPGGWFR